MYHVRASYVLPLSRLFSEFSSWQGPILRRVELLAVVLFSQNLELDIYDLYLVHAQNAAACIYTLCV